MTAKESVTDVSASDRRPLVESDRTAPPKAAPNAGGRRWAGLASPIAPRLTGILFVLQTGIPWEHLPQEMGCGSGMTAWRRLQEWNEQGVWQRLHEVLLAKLHQAERIDWSRAVIDSSQVRAVLGGSRRGHPRWTVAARAPSTT